MILGVDIGTQDTLALLNPQGDLLDIATSQSSAMAQNAALLSMGGYSRSLFFAGMPSRHTLSMLVRGLVKVP
jgi:hypothetical protein